MILASLAAALWLVAYAALCASQPFNASGKLRAGRRAWNAWHRNRQRGSR